MFRNREFAVISVIIEVRTTQKMQKLTSYLFTLLMVVSVLSFTACGGGGGGDDEPDLTPEEQRLLDLAGSTGTRWTATSISFDGAPAVGFENFSLTLFGTDPTATLTYNSTDGDPLFASSGTWAFNGTNINQIIVDGNTNNVYNISNLQTDSNPATMTLTVNFTSGGGVANGVSGTDGTYVFDLEAQ